MPKTFSVTCVKSLKCLISLVYFRIVGVTSIFKVFLTKSSGSPA